MAPPNPDRARAAAPPVSEPACISPVFVDELVQIVPAGAVTHLLFTICQTSAYDGSKERLAQCRLVVPSDRLPQMAKALLAGQLDLAPAANADEEATPLH